MVAMNQDSPTLLAAIVANWIRIEGHKILTAAIQLGVDESTVCNWIMGRSLPKNDSIDRLAICLCVSGLGVPYYEARQILADCIAFDKQHRSRKCIARKK
jgi:hypothetical protein